MTQNPLWITNFKHYESAVGADALALAKMHERVALETGARIAIAVNVVDLYRVAKEVKIPVFAQHTDPIDYGKSTGFILPQAVKKVGAIGTLLNHSEHRLEKEILESAAACAQKATLQRIICAESPEELEIFLGLQPDFLAFEPPELIGSTTVSVASAKPQSIAESVRLAGKIPLLVGAGINSVRDVEVSLSLGARGFLVATSITKSPNPEKALRDFVAAF